MQNPVSFLECNIKSAIAAFFVLFLLFQSSLVKADWLSDANARIEQIRKRNLQITVVDSNGSPVRNAFVQIKQIRHRFAFGSCIAYSPLASNSSYRNFFLDHFEWAVCENAMKWASDEAARNVETYSQADYIANWCANNGITLRGHCVVWETGNQTPAWVSGLNCDTYPRPSEKLDEINERINSVVGRYKGQIVQWDINNEMLSGSFYSCLGEAGRAHFFELANQIDPDCAMYMNEYSGNSFGGYDGGPYANRAKGLIALGAPVEGLGIQGHVSSPFQPEKYYNNVLQKLAVVGVPIMATEYDTDASGDSQRADDLENFYRICFSHASVEGVIMWGFWEGSIWRGKGLVKNDWTLNAAGVRYEKLLQEWTTSDSNFTDLSGSASFRGFHGTYEITLTAAGKPAEVHVIELEPGETNAEFVFESNLEPTVPVRNLNSGGRYVYIQQAITEADPCDLIIVSPGKYSENIDFLGKKLTLSSCDPNNPAIVASTIIKGSDKAVTFSRGEDANSIITGFTITDADTGIYCSGASPAISRCVITGNKSYGIELRSNASPDISYCEISCNKGSGVAVSDSRTSYSSRPSIQYTLIAANSLHGISYGLPLVNNCTIVDNGQRGIFGQSPSVNNSIIFYNSRSSDNVQMEVSSAIVTYSDIQGGWPGAGNINSEPLFVMPGRRVDVNDPNIIAAPNAPGSMWINGDYHLKSQAGRWNPETHTWLKDSVTSPCIDAGNPDSDWGEELWPHGKRINMGAYGGTSQACMSLLGAGDRRDLNNDDSVNWNDVLLVADKWDCNGAPLKEDLDRNGCVDANDLAFFNGNWSGISNNSTPVFDIITDKNVTINTLLSFNVSATDNDGDEIAYKALGLPEGAAFQYQTFSWKPELAGTYFVTFIASDNKSLDYMTVRIIADDQ